MITELPYSVGAEAVIEKDQRSCTTPEDHRVSAVTDLSDGRAKGSVWSSGEEQLPTPTRSWLTCTGSHRWRNNFTINAVALVDSAPKTLRLRELLQVFLDHRVPGDPPAQRDSG